MIQLSTHLFSRWSIPLIFYYAMHNCIVCNRSEDNIPKQYFFFNPPRNQKCYYLHLLHPYTCHTSCRDSIKGFFLFFLHQNSALLRLCLCVPNIFYQKKNTFKVVLMLCFSIYTLYEVCLKSNRTAAISTVP
jgi:hypothetical protein